MPATLRLDTARLGRAMDAFVARALPAEAKRAVETLLRDVGHEAAANLEGGGGLPRRIDTTWLQQAYQSLGDGSPNPDVVADVENKRYLHNANVEIRVPYAVFVETGTVHMAAGNHVSRALYVVRRRAEAIARDAVATAWAAK
jgi:hypothetical protein